MAAKLIDQFEIVTDNKWRPFKFGYEVPAKIKGNDFDWLEDDGAFDGFIFYRRRWYHLSEFMRIEDKSGPLAASGWHGYQCDSYSSGTVIKISEDGEQYKIARFYC